jgi:hypothetical protein
MLSFDPPQTVDRFNLGKLDPIRRAQFYVAIGLAVGSPNERNAAAKNGGVPAPEVLEKQLRRCEGMFYSWQWYRGHDEGRHAYDGWFLGDDCGSVFHADSATETGVVMTQSSIYAETKQVSEEFVAAVKAAYRAARPKYDSNANNAYWEDYQAKLGRKIEEENDFGEDD